MPNSLPRRTLIAAALAGATCRPGRAASETLHMATWGGGNGKMWQSAFAGPFSKETGIPVSITEVAAPESQIRSDGDHPQYQVAIVSIAEAILLRQEGMIQDLDAVSLPGIKDIPAAMLPRDAAGKLIGVVPYFQYVGIALNTDMAKPADFASWRALADSRWKGKLAISRPAYSAMFDMTMLAIANGGSVRDIQPGLKDFAGYVANSMTSYSSMAQMNQLLMRGEITAGSYYSSRVWEMRKQGNDNLTLAIPKEGVFPMTYAVVVPKAVPMTPALAQWLAYVTTPEPQLRAYTLSGYNPASTAARIDPARTQAELGLSLEELRSKMAPLDWSVLAAEQKNRTAIAEKIFADAK